MPEGRDDYEKELAAVWDALAETVAESSDQEILAQAREEGIDVHTTANRVRDILRHVVKARQQVKLREAQERYRKRILEIYQAQQALPQRSQDRRALLSAIFAKIPEMRSVLLTTQHREFEGLTDADVASCLKQLAYLGILDKLSDSSE